MKTTYRLIASLLLLLASLAVSAAERQLAFPGAQGWGRFATGGRTGTVYHVTNLNDSGAGSLRDAVSQPSRIVVFDVAGVIRLNSRLVFKNNLYVAGQTAPGEGVTVYGDGVSFSGANNIIVRYMRFRMGHNGTSGKDAAGLANGQQMIFDHCSFAWGLDETFSINPDGKGLTPMFITLQHSIVGQGLMTHSAGGLMQTDSVSLVGNFLCDNSTRNFKVKGTNQYANNMVYNWSNGAYIMGGDSEGKSFVNIQSNLFINGPAKGGAAFTGGNADFSCYGADNWQDSNMDGVFNPTEITDYNAATRVQKPYDYPSLELNPGRTLLDTNLPTVGASLPYRDPVDCYMVDEVLSYGRKGALISNEETLVYGAPSTWKVYAGQQKADADGDGMPDAWEQANGTNPQQDDAMTISANGYANIENYINSITAADRDFFLRTPVGLELVSATTTTLRIAWRDYTTGEEGFAVEIATDGTFREAARTAAGATYCTVSGLVPGTKYSVRIRAFAGDKTSDYTAAIEVSTRPVEVGIVDVDTFQPDYTWTEGDYDGQQADGKNVLLAPAADEATLTLSETVQPAAVVCNSPNSLTVSGVGGIGGAASVNKAGAGTLVLGTTNSYTGATVLHEGIVELTTLKNGGEPSSLGASVEFAQNWVLDGGTYRYTGGNTATNRSAKLTATTVLDISKATVAMSGTVEGTTAAANLVIDGKGQLTVASAGFFGYKGATVLRGSKLYLSTADIAKAGIGSSSKLVMEGGHLQTSGETSGYETYSFPIEVAEGTVSQFSPFRNCYIKCPVTGAGTLQLNIPYLREYINANWTGFTGRLIANGVSTDKAGSLLLLQKGNENALSRTTVTLKGNARLCAWDTNPTCSVGGLSGASGTYLMGSSKNTKNFNCTWTVGGANTDETFSGIINNWDCSGADRGGTVSITKMGTGIWRLTGNNVYKGTTTVNSGRLVVNGSHTGTGAVTVNSGATLAGKGTVAAKVTVRQGGTVFAGDTLINGSRLTLNGGLTVEQGGCVELPIYSRDNACRANQIAVKSVTINGATLVVNMERVTSIPDNQAFEVFSGLTTVSGSGFAAIEPAQPSPTQEWDTTELLTKGRLYVRPAGTAAAIGSVGADAPHHPRYSLQGVRVGRHTRGLYIEDGRKYTEGTVPSVYSR